MDRDNRDSRGSRLVRSVNLNSHLSLNEVVEGAAKPFEKGLLPSTYNCIEFQSQTLSNPLPSSVEVFISGVQARMA